MTAQNSDHDRIVKKISEDLNIDRRVVNAICRHSSEFTSRVFRDVEDCRAIRWKYLGVLAIMKNRKKK